MKRALKRLSIFALSCTLIVNTLSAAHLAPDTSDLYVASVTERAFNVIKILVLENGYESGLLEDLYAIIPQAIKDVHSAANKAWITGEGPDFDPAPKPLYEWVAKLLLSVISMIDPDLDSTHYVINLKQIAALITNWRENQTQEEMAILTDKDNHRLEKLCAIEGGLNDTIDSLSNRLAQAARPLKPPTLVEPRALLR